MLTLYSTSPVVRSTKRASINVRVSATKEDGQALRIPLKEDRTARAQTMLEAHEALIKAVPENLPKFKDVIQYLEEELHLSK